MSAHLDRAFLLYHQSRYDLAEKELRPALAADPDDATAHALLALCLAQLKKFDAATEEAERAIACGPGLAFAHFALATARYRRNHYPEAEAATREAIRLDPADPDHYALLAATRADQGDWRGALAAADEGLGYDPEHAACVNVRAMALVKLDRRAEAGATIEGALARDPDDAFTHANRGWALLHDTDPKRALEHFREALRLDPDLEFARAGMIEAMKARYWVYRQVLRYFLWMSRLSPQARWGLVIGLLVLQRVVARVAVTNRDLQPVLEPILIAYLVFVVTTWTAVPLSNLLLRLNRFGRLALSPDQRAASSWVGGCLAVAIAGVGYGVVAPPPFDPPGWMTALAFVILVFPVNAIFDCQPGWPRRVMAAYAAGMLLVALIGLGLFIAGISRWNTARQDAVELADAGFELLQGNMWAGVLSVFVAAQLKGVYPRL
jgi:tetratricopeptide (TPR) repeat protein